MEKITRAAISWKNQNYIGFRHASIYEDIYYLGYQYGDKCIEGFLTDEGRFVDRYEAYWIAAKAGQLKEIESREDTAIPLYSEDVW